MEELMELVAASFARHGIACPASAGTTVLASPAEPSSTSDNGLSNPRPASTAAGESTLVRALPEHNYRRKFQDDPAP
jgi:hypothetical protein